MHISTLETTDELQHAILRALRDMGVKHRLKKINVNKYTQIRKGSDDGRLFKKPLNELHLQKVTLDTGIQTDVPSFIIEACKHIEQNCTTEGLFRKAGSNARQREIKTYLDSGGKLGMQHHVIDVANVLKHFFRELPEPLLPYVYHDIFMRCLLLKQMKVEAILLTCLLLPSVHLDSLEYVMQFFQRVASQSETNKMDTRNLAIILTPSIMPVEEKITNQGTRLEYHVSIVEVLLENASEIGLLPDNIYSQLKPPEDCGESLGASLEEIPKTKKKKKRRSGSLTRMLNGLKKMVGKGSPNDDIHPITSTPDFSTPLMKSTKKRKILENQASAFSSKKKQEVLNSLPQGVALSSVPFTPTPARCVSRDLYLTPQVCNHPNPPTKSTSPRSTAKNRKLFSTKAQDTVNSNLHPDPLCAVPSSQKKRHSGSLQAREESGWLQRHTASLERRWSTGLWRRKRRHDPLDLAVPLESPCTPDTAMDDLSTGDINFPDAVVNLSDCEISQSVDDKISSTGVEDSNVMTSDSIEFVRIPKSEYEAIKNRVSAIENQITQEFANVDCSPSEELVCGTESVQCAYERTLEEQARLDGTSSQDTVSTDQLARRLSRELRIRRSLDGTRPIRSPSARKIGSLRRRSREIEAQKQRRNSWASPNAGVSIAVGSALRRGRPNTVMTGLRRPCRRSSSYHGQELNVESDFSVVSSNICAPRKLNSMDVLTDQHLLTAGRKLVEPTVEIMDVSRTPHLHERDYHISETHMASSIENNNNFTAAELWFAAGKDMPKTPANYREPPVTGRASVARIRNENAGIVLQRMRLFDNNVGGNSTNLINKARVLHNRSHLNSLERTALAHASQQANAFTDHKSTKQGCNAKAMHNTTTSHKKRTNNRSPKEVIKKTRNKRSKSAMSRSNAGSPKGKVVRKSHSCKVPRSQHCNSRCNRSTMKPEVGGKENVLNIDDQFFRNHIASLQSKKYQEISRKPSYLNSPQSALKEVSSPLKERNRVDLKHVVLTRNNIEDLQRTKMLNNKDIMLTQSPGIIQKAYSNVGAAGRLPTTPLKTVTSLHSTPLRRSPRLQQSCL